MEKQSWICLSLLLGQRNKGYEKRPHKYYCSHECVYWYRFSLTFYFLFFSLIKTFSGLPWWLSSKESTWQWGRHGSNPWSGKIPHAMEQPRPCTTTTESVLLSPGATDPEPTCLNYRSPGALGPVLHDKRRRDSEQAKHCNQGAAPTLSNDREPMKQQRPTPANK